MYNFRRTAIGSTFSRPSDRHDPESRPSTQSLLSELAPKAAKEILVDGKQAKMSASSVCDRLSSCWAFQAPTVQRLVVVGSGRLSRPTRLSG